MNTTFGILLNLLIFGGTVSISAIFSMGVIGQYVAFTTPIAIRTFSVRKNFRPGPWNLGRWSFLCGTISTCFTLLLLPILSLPAVKGQSLSAKSVNWTSLVWAGPMLLALIWWQVSAKRWFKGPKVNIKHRIHQRAYDEDISEAKVV
jgi:amino acid transporter